ncbi:MAG: hypothetical protein DRQ48_10210 [Gammaproteobacteria bacterium]|nr:MAG: hypothetical protein DRQ48_10210 [Gammaproteobacteria bacterium]
MYIINTQKDWADEFDYPVISIFDNFQIQKIYDTLDIAQRRGYQRFYVCISGQNMMEFMIDEARILVETAETSMDIMLARQLNKIPAVDMVSFILDSNHYTEPFKR